MNRMRILRGHARLVNPQPGEKGSCGRVPESLPVRFLLLIGIAALCFAGCRPAPPPPAPTPSPTPALPAQWPPGPTGAIDGVPFTTRSVRLWQDETAAWLSFDPNVPVTDGHFDPVAQQRPYTSFIVYVKPALLVPGTYSASAGQIPAGSPIAGAAIQIVNEKNKAVLVVDEGWRCTLTITAVLARSSQTDLLRGAKPSGLNLAGRIDLQFQGHGASLRGDFLAHDLLRDDQVAPGQPSVPTPVISPGKTE